MTFSTKFFGAAALAISALLSGCDGGGASQQQDASITILRERVAAMQSQDANLMLSISNLQARVDALYQFAYIEGHKIDSNSAAILELADSQAQQEIEKINAESARIDAKSSTPSSSDSSSGIPDDVEAKIRADAEQEFPDNYVMQQTAIQSQEAAYRQLHQ